MFGTVRKFWDCVVLGFNFFKVSLQIMYGAWKVSTLPQPVVCIFGGHLLPKGGVAAQKAFEIAKMLAKHNISVLTGGGPGLMEAASAGAEHEKPEQIRAMGIGVYGLKGEEHLNPYVRDSVILDYFFARKYLMIYYAQGFIVLPGGVGTMDELSELLNLIQTEKREKVKVVLIGTEFWKHYLAWLETAKQEGLLLPSGALDCLTVTDDLEQAVHIFVKDKEKHT